MTAQEDIDLIMLADETEGYNEKWENVLSRKNMSKKVEVDFLLREQKKEFGWEY